MTAHVIILISGKQGSGKTTLADNLQAELTLRGLPTYRTRFAKVLYLMHDAVRDIGLSYGIPFPKKIGPLLQYMGTELVRNNYGENSWVTCLKVELSKLEVPNFVIIDDARFENEIVAFDKSENSVHKVRLLADKDTRKGRADGWRDNDTHPSETGLDDYGNWNLTLDTSVLDQTQCLQCVIDHLMGVAKGNQ